MRIRVALTLGAFLIAGGAFTGTALASTPAPTAPPAPPTATPTSAAPRPTDPNLSEEKQAAMQKADARAKAGNAPTRVPRAIPAGPTGDLHLPAITASN